MQSEPEVKAQYFKHYVGAHADSTLLLRLVVERRLDLGAIALVTFTDAAARELRERLLGRLRELSDALEHPPADGAQPARVAALAALAPADAARPLPRRVRDALLRFDEVTVATIHGFCRRALERLGVATGVGESADAGPLRDAMVADFWRRRVLGGAADEAAWALAHWDEPLQLARDLVDAHALPMAALDPPRGTAVLDSAAAQLRRAREEGCALYAAGMLDATIAALEDAVFLKESGTLYPDGGTDRIRPAAAASPPPP